MGSKLLWPAALNLKEFSWGKQLCRVKGCQGDRSTVCQLPGDPQGLLFMVCGVGGLRLKGRGITKYVGLVPCGTLVFSNLTSPP